MCWRANLAKIINDSKYSAIEIHARTGLSTSTISNMQNSIHESLLCSQFILLRLMFKKTHIDFLNTIFGRTYFKNIKKIRVDNTWTDIGKYFKNNYQYEVFSKKKIVQATGISSSRIEYIFKKNYESIKIDEITKLEIVTDNEIGHLSNIFFSQIRLNTDERYEFLLQRQREINRKANLRRKIEN